MSVDDLYQELIIDHYRRPRNKEAAAPGAIIVHHDNPLCGDTIDLALEVEGGAVRRVTFAGQGCAISQASASMMTEAVRGLALPRALALVETMRRMMNGEAPVDDLGDLAALEGVQQFPVRIKCALLAWAALAEAIGKCATASAAGETAVGESGASGERGAR